MGAYFGLLVPHSWGFVTLLPYTYLYHQIWLNPLTKKPPKKNTGFETPRAFFLFFSNPFSFFVSAHFTCLSLFVCLLHCFFAVAPYCSPTSSCARSSERKNAQRGRTAASPECDNHSTKASNRKQKTKKVKKIHPPPPTTTTITSQFSTLVLIM